MHIWLRRTILLFAPLAAAYPPPEPCTGWCYEDLRDPNVIYREGTYYRFTTHHNLSIATAPSIAGPWEKHGSVLQNGSMIEIPAANVEEHGHHSRPHAQMLWAPDVALLYGTYYLTYTATRGEGEHEIGLATSKTLERGSWTDHGSIGLPAIESISRVDSNLFLASADSEPLLTYGSYRSGIYQVNFTESSSSIKGEPARIGFNASNDADEAGYLFEYAVKDEHWFYFFFSSGRCCNSPSHLPREGNEYKTMVCRSKSQYGPFVDDVGRACTDSGGKMVLGSQGDVYGPGGQGILYDEQLQSPVIYYHYMNRSTGYGVEQVYFGWNKLSFESGWPVAVAMDGQTNVPDKPKPKSSGAAKAEAAVLLALYALLGSIALLSICN